MPPAKARTSSSVAPTKGPWPVVGQISRFLADPGPLPPYPRPPGAGFWVLMLREGG